MTIWAACAVVVLVALFALWRVQVDSDRSANREQRCIELGLSC